MSRAQRCNKAALRGSVELLSAASGVKTTQFPFCFVVR